MDVTLQRRRQLLAVAACAALSASCTPSPVSPDPDVIASAETDASEPSVSPSPVETIAATGGCEGLGRPRPKGEITFVDEGRLAAISPNGDGGRCLADLTGGDLSREAHSVSWNGPGDRVLIGDRAISRDLGETAPLAGGSAKPVWSRPNGTSVVYITSDGRLMKRSSLGGRATDISFLSRHDDVTYHPAGEHIATSGEAEDGAYGLYLATNLGTEAKLLARGEEAKFLIDLEFAADGTSLYYSAQHGPNNWHLHRLSIGEDATLETLDKNSFGFEVAVSQIVPGFGPHAWSASGDCAAGQPDRLHIAGVQGIQVPSELERTSLRPIGWLPSQKLVVASSPVSCGSAAPRDIYVLRRGTEPVLIAEDVESPVAIRAALPPPPPPPGEEQEVVA